jgi:hypothetical protein
MALPVSSLVLEICEFLELVVIFFVETEAGTDEEARFALVDLH